MILIISQDRFECTTDEIIDWISYFDTPFKRLNGIDFYKNVAINFANSDNEVQIAGIDWEKINVVWFRRWLAYQNNDKIAIKQKKESIDSLSIQFNEFLKSELKTLVTFFFDWIPKNKLFGTVRTDEINKLSVLKKAKELNILIPDTYILTKRSDFDKLNLTSKLITKAISNGQSIKVSNDQYNGYTAIVEEIPEAIGDSFSPSLFQGLVAKKYEIRAFLLSGKFYSMAIFSQNDNQTKIDFRRYNYDNPNRVVPYKLPEDLEKKLIKLAAYFELESGSFDLIKTTDNQHIFLEVNPGGQFGMVSLPCNYYLEKKMALELINFNKPE